MSIDEEIEFIESIDASFPFENEKEAIRIVHRGAEISDNAALMIGLELAGQDKGYLENLRLSLLDQICRERPSKAILVAAPVIDSLIRGITCSENSIKNLLEYCREEMYCYNALGILSYCSPELEEEANKIRKSWNS